MFNVVVSDVTQRTVTHLNVFDDTSFHRFSSVQRVSKFRQEWRERLDYLSKICQKFVKNTPLWNPALSNAVVLSYIQYVHHQPVSPLVNANNRHTFPQNNLGCHMQLVSSITIIITTTKGVHGIHIFLLHCHAVLNWKQNSETFSPNFSD